MRHRLLQVLTVGAALSAAPASAAAQPVRQTALLSVAPLAPTSDCHVDRLEDRLRLFGKGYEQLLSAAVLGTVWREGDGDGLPIAAYCDATAAAAGVAASEISGSLTGDRPVSDAVGAGFRAVEAPLWQGKTFEGGGRGLVAGDVVTLPPASSARVWVRAGQGTVAVDVGGGAAANVAVQPGPGGTTAIDVTRDGVTRRSTVAPVAPASLSVTGKRRGRVLRLSVAGAPSGAWILASSGESSKGRQSTGAATSVNLRLERGTRSGRATVMWNDIASRRFAAAACAFGARSGARVRCVPLDIVAAGERAVAATAPSSLRVAARPASPAGHPSAPTASAARAALRFPMHEIPLDVSVVSVPVGDLNGDGHDDLVGASADLRPGDFEGLYLSRSDGRLGQRVATLPSSFLPAGDIDGDGLPETLVQGSLIAFGTGNWNGLRTAGDFDLPAGDPRALRVYSALEDEDIGVESVAPLPDVTGDGRSELALSIDGTAFVVGSSSVTRGATIELPRIADLPPGPLDLDDPPTAEPPPIADAGGTHALQFIRRPTTKQSITVARIQTRDARGALVRELGPIQLRGDITVFTRDPGSGAFLVGAEDPDAGRSAVFTVARVDQSGATTMVGVRGGGLAVFGPDGPDPDAAGEIYIDGSRGLTVLGSATRGRVSASTLPVVTDRRGEVLGAQLADSGEDGGAPRSILVQGLRGRYGDHWSRLVLP